MAVQNFIWGLFGPHKSYACWVVFRFFRISGNIVRSYFKFHLWIFLSQFHNMEPWALISLSNSFDHYLCDSITNKIYCEHFCAGISWSLPYGSVGLIIICWPLKILKNKKRKLFYSSLSAIGVLILSITRPQQTSPITKKYLLHGG